MRTSKPERLFWHDGGKRNKPTAAPGSQDPRQMAAIRTHQIATSIRGGLDEILCAIKKHIPLGAHSNTNKSPASAEKRARLMNHLAGEEERYQPICS